MAIEPFKPQLRLVFQGSVPFEEPAQAEAWYTMLKEMVKSQSLNATLNGQVVKVLEPCCSDKAKTDFAGRVGYYPPGQVR